MTNIFFYYNNSKFNKIYEEIKEKPIVYVQLEELKENTQKISELDQFKLEMKRIN